MQDGFLREKEHLKKTVEYINALRSQSEDDVLRAYDELNYARTADSDSLDVREMLYSQALNNSSRYSKAAQKPYFTRIDFIESGADEASYYIGKYGINDASGVNPVIIDWRAPIANLYYSDQLGHVSYTAPDGKIEGELTLKRQFDIKNGDLLGVFDADVSTQDVYLQKALDCMSGDRLRDIVSTIRSEQNLVLRQPLGKNLIVQGAAGSGKTTVALHRIAYLLYAYSDRLRPERMLILAPNPLFLDYISGVLPDLGVENVRQSTYESFMAEQTRLPLKLIEDEQRLKKLLSASAEERARLVEISQAKGSRAFADALDAFLNEYERRFVPNKAVRLGPIVLWSHDEAERFMLTDEAPFPFEHRVNEFEKQLLKRARAAAESLCKWYKTEAQKRVNALETSIKDASELKKKIAEIYSSRDKRIQEVKREADRVVSELIASMPSLKPIDIYKTFLEAMQLSGSFETAAKHTLNCINSLKGIEREDIAPLMIISLCSGFRPKLAFRHVVIDEAQDYNPMQIIALKRLMPEASFTLTGDLMQGISAARGVSDWNEITNGAFESDCGYAQLATSYRSTREIMNEAFKAARTYQDGSRINVIRSGEKCDYIRVVSEIERAKLIESLVLEAKKKGRGTVAVIERDLRRAQKLASLLNPALGIRLLNKDADAFGEGVYICDSVGSKGLEFDEVIIADASEKVYGIDELAAKQLYVALTRALHKLTVVYRGELTELLR